MTTESPDGIDLVSDAVSLKPDEPISPLVKKTEFLAWHRPRKHFVRIDQWCKQVRALIRDRISQFKERPLHYVSLPGDDLLDIRTLEGVFTRELVRLRYLGFNSGKGTEASLSETEVNNLPFIERTSFVIGDRFEMLAQKTSMAYLRAKEIAPFDVVNLDLCSSAADAPPSADVTIFSALKNILELQQNSQGGDWLLFLTTRADKSTVNSDALAALLRCIRSNVENHSSFENQLTEQLGIAVSDLSEPTGLKPDGFALTFGLGVCKWLLSIVNGIGFGWDVELTSENYWYRVNGDEPDMLSLSFRFSRRNFVHDATGLTGSAAPPSARTELDLALGMISRLGKICDVDKLLTEDSEKHTKAVRRSRAVLEKARYDGDAYERWVAEGFIGTAKLNKDTQW